MTAVEFYKEAKEWQSGIAALLGFTGLIVGALWNFRLTRVRDASIRREEKRAVAAVIYSETLMLREQIYGTADLAIHFAEIREEEPYLPLDLKPFKAMGERKPELFNELIGKVGLLDPTTVRHLIDFHYAIRDVWTGLHLIDFSQKTISISVIVGPTFIAIRNANKALRRLERVLRLRNTAETLDMDRLIAALRADYDRGGTPPEAYGIFRSFEPPKSWWRQVLDGWHHVRFPKIRCWERTDR